MISLPDLRSTKLLLEPGAEPGPRVASGERPRSFCPRPRFFEFPNSHKRASTQVPGARVVGVQVEVILRSGESAKERRGRFLLPIQLLEGLGLESRRLVIC